VNRPDVRLRLHWSRDDAIDREKSNGRDEDYNEEERRKDLANPPPRKVSSQ